jgi:hypothetical protein
MSCPVSNWEDILALWSNLSNENLDFYHQIKLRLSIVHSLRPSKISNLRYVLVKTSLCCCFNITCDFIQGCY